MLLELEARIDDGQSRLVQRFASDEVSIGRAADCDFVLEHASVSRRHAIARHEADGWFIEDRGSRHGTRLNGLALHGRARLSGRDTLEFGTTMATIRLIVTHGEGAEVESTTCSVAVLVKDDASADASTDSSVMAAIEEILPRIARSSSTVLITGETGTGKEYLARRIHAESERAHRPFIIVNCPTVPAGIFESEMFGVEAGVATGVSARRGRVEQAQHGTVLFDEIGELDLNSQAKLLRFIEDRSVDRLGARSRVPIDVRILAATNRDLQHEVGAGRFRADLYYRLAVFVLHLSPLRDRLRELPALASALLRRRDSHAQLSPGALAVLAAHGFPGNVRELAHILERAAVLARSPIIQPDDLQLNLTDPTTHQADPAAAGAQLWASLVHGASFWDVVHSPYLRRELSREQVRECVALGYEQSNQSYKTMAERLGIAPQYRRFLDFLKHNRLGPTHR